MLAYIARRLLLMIPTIFGILLISFIIVQFAPGGPVERVMAQLQGLDQGATARFTGGGGDLGASAQLQGSESRYRGAQGLDPQFIAELQKQFGFDKPAPERFLKMLEDYATFNFGRSYFRDVPVLELIREKLPVSISLGLWMTLLSYAISIPLGIRKAVKDGTRFDTATSAVVIVGYAIPSFLFAILLIVLFAGGSFWQIFPLRGLTSDNWQDLPLFAKITDYLWHITLPVTAMSIGAFATSTFLTKNSFLEEIRKQYVQTARMKGLTRAARSLWTRLPQCHADRRFGISGRFRQRLLHRRAAHREHILARRTGAPLLQIDHQPRLSGRLRQSLYIRSHRSRREPALRPHLYMDRSAHRFRDAGGVR